MNKCESLALKRPSMQAAPASAVAVCEALEPRVLLSGTIGGAYEVWGGFTDYRAEPDAHWYYENIDQQDYDYLGQSDSTATFDGTYDFYVVAAQYPVGVDTVEGSNGTYASEAGSGNTLNPENIGGVPDGQSAIVGNHYSTGNFRGYVIIENADTWTDVTVHTTALAPQVLELWVERDDHRFEDDGYFQNYYYSVEAGGIDLTGMQVVTPWGAAFNTADYLPVGWAGEPFEYEDGALGFEAYTEGPEQFFDVEWWDLAPANWAAIETTAGQFDIAYDGGNWTDSVASSTVPLSDQRPNITYPLASDYGVPVDLTMTWDQWTTPPIGQMTSASVEWWNGYEECGGWALLPADATSWDIQLDPDTWCDAYVGFGDYQSVMVNGLEVMVLSWVSSGLSFSTELGLYAGPDLLISDSGPLEIQVAPGEPVVVPVEVFNAGTESAWEFDVALYFSGDPNVDQGDGYVGGYDVFELQPAESYSEPINFIAPLQPGRYYLAAMADDWDYVGESNEANNWGPTVELVVGVVDAAVVEGTVYDYDTGDPLAGIYVDIFQGPDAGSAGPDAWDYVTSVFTDATGRYEVFDLPQRSYHIHVWEGQAAGGNHYIGGDLYDVPVVDGATTSEMDFNLNRAGYLFGYVYDSAGNPLENIEVVSHAAYTHDNGFSWHSDWTDVTGRYEIWLLETDLEIYPVQIGHQNAPLVYGVQVAPGLYASDAAGMAGPDFYLDEGGLLHGRLLTSAGAPVANYVGGLSPFTVVAGGLSETPPIETDANGEFWLPVPADMDIYLSTSDWGWDRFDSGCYAWGDRWLGAFNVLPGQTVDLGELTVPEAATVSGTVTDSLGNPVADAEIGLFGYDVFGGQVYLNDGDGVFTDELGQYSWDWVPAGELTVAAWADGFMDYRSDTTLDLAPGDEVVFDLTMTPVADSFTVAGGITNFPAAAPSYNGGPVLPYNIIEYESYFCCSCEGLGLVAYDPTTPWTADNFLLPERQWTATSDVADGYGDYFEADDGDGMYEINLPAGGSQVLFAHRSGLSATGGWYANLSDPMLFVDEPAGQWLADQDFLLPLGTSQVTGAVTFPQGHPGNVSDGSVRIYLYEVGMSADLPGRAIGSPGPNSQYVLSDLPAGEYYIYAVADGVAPFVSDTFTLAEGETFNQDIQFELPGEIHGYKWDDQSQDGFWDYNEPALEDWVIYLDQNENGELDGEEAWTTTGEDGSYSFYDLPAGTYFVAEVLDAQIPPAYWVQSHPVEGVHVVDLQPGDVVTEVNFGNFWYEEPFIEQGEIHGLKWNDLNEDGVPDEGEEGLDDWVIFLDQNDNGTLDAGETWTTTYNGGYYDFFGLEPGSYIVAEQLQPGWQQTYPGGPGVHLVDLIQPDDVVWDVDFGNVYHAAAEPEVQTVVLAFGQDAPVQVIGRRNLFGTVYYPLLEGTTPAADVAQATRDFLLQKVQEIFTRSGVENVTVTDTPTAGATVVYFGQRPNIPGWSMLGLPYSGIDRFNQTHEGGALVFLTGNNLHDAEIIAHEVGHLLGLRHVNPAEQHDPLNASVMDNELPAADNSQFSGALSDIWEPLPAETHNPLYHMRHYIDGVPEADLIAQGILPGTWDQGSIDYTNMWFAFEPADQMLYDVMICAGHELAHMLPIVEFEAISLTQLSALELTIESGSFMQLVAASTPGRSWDIALTSGDPYFDENHFIRVEPGQSIAYLQRYARNGQGYETIADVTVLGNWVYGGPDDAYEENDSRAEAYDLSDHQATWLSNLDGPGIQADQDWYEIFVPAGQERVFVDCRFDHLMGDIDIGLYDSAGNLLDGSYSFSDDEYIDYVVPGSGAYFVRVAYSDWGNEYDLWWDVQGPPDPPVANDDAATLAEDSGPFAVDVLANDVDSSDPSEPLAVVSAWGAEHGFVQVANGGSSVSYRPYADFNGFDSFTYTIMQNGQTDTATVFVEVTPVNDAPTAWGQDVATDMDQSVDIPLAADDPETPYSDLVFDITQPPAHGTLTEIGPGQYSYEPDAGYIGPDSFTYTVTDDGDPAGSGEGAADSGPAVVNVQVGRRVDLDARGQVTFEDSNGNLVTVRLRGEGTGYLLFAHDGPCDVGRIVLNGTNEDSSLFITIRGRGAETTVVDILVNGSLQNLQGSCVNLLGDVTVTGSLAKLVLADVADQHVITIGPRPVDDITTTLTMQFRRVEDTSVFSQTPLGIVTAIDWQDNDETRDVIEAASLDMLRIQGRRARPWQDVPAVAGDFGADLILQTLGTARIAADMVDCLWEIAGGMGNLTVNGTARDNTVRTAGSMGNLVFGAVENSDFLAGCAEGVGRHAEAREDFVNLLAGINLVRIRGFRMPWGAPRPRLVTNSNFSAATFGNVRLMNVDYDNGGDAFGLFACDLGPGREIQSVRHRDTEDASQNWNWPPAGGEVFDHPDLAIEII